MVKKLVIDNVLVGEVWLCSGQSNMEMPLKGFQNCPVEGGNESIATSGAWKNKIRFVTVPWTEKLIPQESCSGQWKCSYLKCTSGLVLWDTTMHK